MVGSGGPWQIEQGEKEASWQSIRAPTPPEVLRSLGTLGHQNKLRLSHHNSIESCSLLSSRHFHTFLIITFLAAASLQVVVHSLSRFSSRLLSHARSGSRGLNLRMMKTLSSSPTAAAYSTQNLFRL
jgi:hypothetical protein